MKSLCPKCGIRPRREPGQPCNPCIKVQNDAYRAKHPEKFGRIGYGKGHFDRAIAGLETQHPVLTVGLAYAVQEIDEVPIEPHDRLHDIIVTEAELIRTKSA